MQGPERRDFLRRQRHVVGKANQALVHRNPGHIHDLAGFEGGAEFFQVAAAFVGFDEGEVLVFGHGLPQAGGDPRP